MLIALALLAAPGQRAARARTTALLEPQPPAGGRSTPVLAIAVALLLGTAVALGVGGVAGPLAGAVLAVCVGVGMRRLGAPRPLPVDPLAVASTLDLLAACLRGGLPVASAARVVLPSAPAPVASVLRQAADLLTMGAEPEDAWAAAAAEESTAGLARLARRSARSGSPLARGVAELAAEQRAAAEDSAAAAAERAGVLVTGPLGLCFLPAFLCLGVVPVVLGLAGPVLRGGLVG